MNIIEIHWQDAGLESAQICKEEAMGLKLMLRKNTGYEIRNDEEVIVLCFGLIEDKGMCVCDQTLIVPQSLIRDYKVLFLE